ncbi:MAG: acyl-CoA dehydrogenase family protein [Sphingorhabdus sp.]
MSDDALDLDALRDSFRDVLGDALSVETLLRHGESAEPVHHALWAQIVDLGWPGLAITEEHGGLGLGFDTLAILYEELGRSLAPVPVLPTMLVAEALTLGGSAAQQREWLPKIASGELMASLTPPGERPAVIARRDGEYLVLDGVAEGLVDGGAAGLLLVAVMIDGQALRVLVESETVEHQPCYDLTRSLGRLAFSGRQVPLANLLVRDVEPALIDHASIALACEAVGGAERILDITLDYLKTREQFGRVIGSFQALKHRAANHKTDIVSISALTREAVIMRARDEDVRLEAAAAKAYACDVFAKLTRDAIQLHGGIGVTWEQVCHLYMKRARLNEQLYGTTAQHLDRLIESLAA